MSYTQSAQGGKDFFLKIGNGASGSVTFQDTGDTVTLNNHGLVAGDIVSFSVITTTTGIVINTPYYVVNPTTNTFQVASTLGGSALALTTNGTGTLDEHFNLVGGSRSASISMSAEGVDITSHDSSQWKELLDAAGINSVSLSGSGVFRDDINFKRARNSVINRSLKNWRIYTNTSGDYFSGCFKLTSLEQTGDYNNEQTWTFSLESSGAVSYTEV